MELGVEWIFNIKNYSLFSLGRRKMNVNEYFSKEHQSFKVDDTSN